MKITIKDIKFKNFLSYGNAFTELNLTKCPKTIILGVNGVGKSVFLDAICFCLFGKPYRKINKPVLCNSVNEKNLVVEGTIIINKNEYIIKRGIKPTIFELYCNGKLVNQTASSKDYQEYLETHVLKLNFRTFCQIVVLGSNNYVPFMELSAAHRREVVEDLLDIKIFSQMNDILKTDVAVNKLTIDQTDSEISSLKDKISLIKSQLESLNKDKTEQLKKLKTDKKEKQIELKNLLEKKTLYEQYNKELDSEIKLLEQEHNELESQKAKKKELETILLRIQKAEESFSNQNTCPTCTQEIAQSFKDEKLKTFTTKIHITKESIDKFKDVDNKLKELNMLLFTKNNQFIDNSGIISNTTSDIRLFQNNLIQIDSQIKQLETVSGSIEENEKQLKQFKEELISKLKNKDDLDKNKEIYNIASTLLKDNGIKTKVVKKYVPIINNLINKYLNQMELNIAFEFDENFNEKMNVRFREEQSYQSLSQGQKHRVNLAIIFAWRDIAKFKSSANINLLIMDEVFDSSLDENGVDSLFKILNSEEVKTSTNVFVISHKSGLDDKFERAITVELVSNFSRIKEHV